jgi:hypothetical protein
MKKMNTMDITITTEIQRGVNIFKEINLDLI